ncbi:MAG: PIG-L family deacetylase [Flavobacteriaceae bacterium]|nr:PIG-L family deacetylase [Flavobacteriaceae bacterium]
MWCHPDDENTTMTPYFSNDFHAQAAYLSITRGDGGQNLIGSEIGAPLGVIRTHELLKARSVDGGQQFFTRANDFGYSKDPEETEQIWDREKVLSDMVRVMREFQPDIVINRFDAGSAGKTHGHHTSSAILSLEAFDLAGKPDYQVADTEPWNIKRIFFNTSWWFYGSEENFEKADKSKMLKINMGTYFPELGLSNNEIAAMSRSMHKSQGFGSTGTRGDEAEYLELLKGDMPLDKDNIFEGVDTSWNRVKGAKPISALLHEVEKHYNFRDPSASLPALLKAHQLISQLPEGHWKKIKSREIVEIIAACAGLYMEAAAEVPFASPGDSIKVRLEVINRSQSQIQLQNVRTSFSKQIKTKEIKAALEYNKRWNQKEQVLIPVGSEYTSPYWLDDKSTLGMYHVADENNIGLPLSGKKNKVLFDVRIANDMLTFEREVIYKYNDPVKGEVYEPFEILPPLTSSIAGNVIIFNDPTPKVIPLAIVAHKDKVKGNASLKVPEGWRISPEEMPFDISKKGGEQVVSFTLIPPNGQSVGSLRAVLTMDGKSYDQSLTQIEYDHIPKLNILFPAETKVVRLNLTTAKKRIAYVTGAGDEVPASLEQIGYEVVEIKPEEIEPGLLKSFDAVIVGIRAYNIHDVLALKQSVLLEYVKEGGNMIVQYNTHPATQSKG